MTDKATTSPLTEDQRLMVEEHLHLVQAIARGWRGRCRSTTEFGDLVQVGSIGLAEAARRFDPSRGIPFSVLAGDRIRGSICDYFRSLDPLTRSRRKAVRALEETKSSLRTELGREPGRDDVGARLGWDGKAVASACDDASALEAGWARPHDGEEWAATQPGSDSQGAEPSQLEALLRTESVHQLRAALETLSERERLVLDLSFREELHLHEIGTILGVTESRACQLRTAALARLRASMTADGRGAARPSPVPAARPRVAYSAA